MKLTAPVYILKQKARELKRMEGIPLSAALNRIAAQEGFKSWSLLQAKVKNLRPKRKEEILSYLNPGDLVLVAARPGQGKTMLALELLLRAVCERRPSFFFSLEYTREDALEKLNSLDAAFSRDADLLHLDFSDEISADYIVNQTKAMVEEGSVIAVDYLQLLDQQRHKPALQAQINRLKLYAKEKKCILVFISQIDRRFDMEERAFPALGDIRLPNPLDLSLFNKTLFLRDGDINL